MTRKGVLEKCLTDFEKPARGEVVEQSAGVELVNIGNLARREGEKSVGASIFDHMCLDMNQIISARKDSIPWNRQR